jgi:hypothetical protein
VVRRMVCFDRLIDDLLEVETRFGNLAGRGA